MTAVLMPSTVPLPQNPSMGPGDFVHLSGDMGSNGRRFHYSVRHNTSLRRYDQHQEQTRPQQQRETELLYQRHLENKSKKKYSNNNKQSASETIGVNHVKVKSEMAGGSSADSNRNNNTMTKVNDRKRSFQQHSSSGLEGSNPSQDTPAPSSSDERLAKKQRTEISLEIVHEPSNSTNLKVTTTIESGGSSDRKLENGVPGHDHGQPSVVSSVVDIRQDEQKNEQSQQPHPEDLLGSSSGIGDILDGLGKPTAKNAHLIKLIEQGDIDKLMKFNNGNDIEQLLSTIIDEWSQELQQCSVPAGGLGGNQEKGDIKDEGMKRGPEDGEQMVLKTEQNPINMDPTRLEPPPNRSVTETFTTFQSLPSIHELKKTATSTAMPHSSTFAGNNPLKAGGSRNQSVPSVYPHQNSNLTNMPGGMGTAASSALSGMAVSSSAIQQRGAPGSISQHQPPQNTNSLVSSTMNQMGNMYMNNGNAGQFLGGAQQTAPPSASHNFPTNPNSSHSTNLAQILKSRVNPGGNSCLPNLSNAFQKGPNRPTGGHLNNGTFQSAKSVMGGYPNARLTPEQYKMFLAKRLQQQRQHQQQAMNSLIRAPPPPYEEQQGAPGAMRYSRGMPPMGRSMGMQQRMAIAGIPQDNMNPAIHMGNPQSLQQQQPQMTAQMAAQHARTSGMRQLLQTGHGQMATARLRNMMPPTRMGVRGHMVPQDRMMSQMQSMQPQHPIGRTAQMGPMMNNATMQQQQPHMNPGHPGMVRGNEQWQGPPQNSMTAMQQQPQAGMGMRPGAATNVPGMNQYQGMNRGNNGLQTVVNVQTSHNTSQNINIQTSVQTHTVLHQPQQQASQQPGGYNSPAAVAAMNNQRLLQMQSRMNRARPTGGPTAMQPQMGAQGSMMVNQPSAATGRPQNPVQSSSQLDLDILNNIISKDT